MQSFTQREQRDDQLRRIAQRRIEQAPDAGPDVAGQMLGRFAHKAGQWDNGQGGCQEDGGRIGVKKLQGQRNGNEHEEQIHAEERIQHMPHNDAVV